MIHLNLLYSYFVISQLILYTTSRNISKLKIDEIISETPIIDSHWPLDKFCASVKQLYLKRLLMRVSVLNMKEVYLFPGHNVRD